MFAPLTVIEAPQGTYATTIGTLIAHDLSTVALTLPPERTTSAAAASEILRALGKRRDVNGKARHGIDDKMLVPVWLTAHRVQNLVIASPQKSNDADLVDVVDLCAATPTNVVIACDHGTADRVLRALQGHLPQVHPWPTTGDDQRSDSPEFAPSKWKPGEPIRLPQCEFLNFYAIVERTLPPHMFAEVSTRYIDALNRTLTWLHDVQEAHEGTVPHEAVNPAMRSLLAEQETLDQVATVVHAAEAAFFRHGWILKVDRRELRSGLVRFPSPDVPNDAWTRLRAYREPARATTVGLYLIGLTINEIEAVTTGEVANWHNDNRLPIAGHTIPPGAAPLLRAQLIACSTIGHGPEEAFLPKSTNRRILSDVREASTDLDFFIGDGALDRTSAIGDRRVSTKAFSVEQIA